MSLTQKQVDDFASRLPAGWSLRKKKLEMYVINDGYLMHRDAMVRIGDMKIGSDKHQQFITDLLKTLSIWHEFTEKYDIMYSLIAANLISAYCSQSILPWEDDIDLTVNMNGWKMLNHIYDEECDTIDIDMQNKYEEMIGPWVLKKYTNLGLYIAKHVKIKGRFKIVTDERFVFYDNWPVPGKLRGIDISVAIPYQDHYIESFWGYRYCYPVCPPISDDLSDAECPVVNYSGTQARVIDRSLGEQYLIDRYGTKWDACIQPRLIDRSMGVIPCEGHDQKINKAIKAVINEVC